MTSLHQMQSQVLDHVRQSNHMTSQLITTMTETWTGAARPAQRSGTHDDAVPGPSDYVDQFFDFWVQMLEAQRGVVLSGINALLPSAPAPEQVAPSTPPRARSLTDGTPSASVATTPSSTAAARTVDSTADEHIGGAAADAIATAAAITAEKTTPVEKTPATTTAAATTAGTPRKTSTYRKASAAEKTSAAAKSSAPKKSSTPEKASTPEKTSATRKTAKKTSTARNKRS